MPQEPIKLSPDISLDSEQKNKPTLRVIIKGVISMVIILATIFTGLYWYTANLNKPAQDFPVGKPITIERGMNVRDIAEVLEQDGVVKSATLLYYSLVFFYEPTDIKASTYLFNESLTTFAVAERLTKGDFDTDLIRFTHFEGERVTQLASRASTVLKNFDSLNFIEKATDLEGKLFPDTYFIPVDYTDEELLTLMLDTFTEKTADLKVEIENHPLSLEDILVLASIIEREANSVESKRLVSSVLQNRLAIDMPLQADASIEYVLNKTLVELTPEDLRIDSPYNTYLNLGLPPTPIGNPGLDAIMAVLEPAESEYYYYITDEEGEFHYSKTYSEHLVNIERYLR